MTQPEPEPSARPARIRREPPRFRPVTVRRVDRPSPRMVRITLAGPELDGFAVTEPAASVRLLLPERGTRELVMPQWNGNEFLLADGRRPTIRTLTPRAARPDDLEVDVDVVVHDGGTASDWATGAAPGDAAAVAGPGRGYTITDAPAFLIGGDETAIPAISQLLEALPASVPAEVRIEISRPDARFGLPEHPGANVEWCLLPAGGAPGDALVAAIRTAELVPGGHVWAAGEAAAVQRIRKYLFEECALPRAQASVRGYWKHGRTGDADDE